MAPRKLEEKDVKRFNFTKFDIDFILENANLNDTQLKIFNRLIDKKGKQSIIEISINENMSTATVSRIIKQIKDKIWRLLD